jgi:hypothetical protein
VVLTNYGSHRDRPNAAGELGRATGSDAEAFAPGRVGGVLAVERAVDIATGACLRALCLSPREGPAG